jgi:phosphatidylserine decarboxylase
MVEQGAEFGFIKFGSRVDVFLPLDAKILVSLGQKTEGGKTVLAQLI